ncbi:MULTISPECIES: hypothetical protein [Asticcacaulis]|uniref:hypothetical protein n=1 Tax=Asticcacaulis TaxID=76890 RepID=UPI001AE7946D|nr:MULTISPECIES: hypothetical protein [Asticcacaulis]MBP2159103.1 hypothetical protein [Asticcacaulis solisilvae]MDR6800148.1 hypothetical protein [Asticcacaulis sp. BE141]
MKKLNITRRVRRTFHKVLVRVRILKPRRAEVLNGGMRTIASRAAGFQATRGMTDAKAKLGRAHCFEIGKPHLLARFLADVRQLIRRGDVRISLNGRVYSPV